MTGMVETQEDTKAKALEWFDEYLETVSNEELLEIEKVLLECKQALTC